MKVEDIKVSMEEIQSVYGPPPESVRGVENVPEKEPNTGLMISNVFVVVALLVLGIIAIVNRKLSKKFKIILLIGIIVFGIVILYYMNKVNL